MQVNHYVIDASFARAAGKPEKLRAIRCAQLYSRIYDERHKCVFNKALLIEWLGAPNVSKASSTPPGHATVESKFWLKKMKSRGLFIPDEVKPHELLRKALRISKSPATEKEGIAKDLHLLELALAYDKLIVSFENRLPNYLKNDALLHGFCRDITWIEDEPDKIPVAKSKP